jgi:hypothetical protein
VLELFLYSVSACGKFVICIAESSCTSCSSLDCEIDMQRIDRLVGPILQTHNSAS